jgi:hypothetical protein
MHETLFCDLQHRNTPLRSPAMFNLAFYDFNLSFRGHFKFFKNDISCSFLVLLPNWLLWLFFSSLSSHYHAICLIMNTYYFRKSNFFNFFYHKIKHCSLAEYSQEKKTKTKKQQIVHIFRNSKKTPFCILNKS